MRCLQPFSLIAKLAHLENLISTFAPSLRHPFFVSATVTAYQENLPSLFPKLTVPTAKVSDHNKAALTLAHKRLDRLGRVTRRHRIWWRIPHLPVVLRLLKLVVIATRNHTTRNAVNWIGRE